MATAPRKSFFCPTHEIRFTSPDADRGVECPSGIHHLRDGARFDEFWEHCLACGTFWPQRDHVSRACPACRAEAGHAYLCHSCGVVTLSADDGEAAPTCRGCGARAPRRPELHACETIRHAIATCRTQCPYCNLALGVAAELVLVTPRPEPPRTVIVAPDPPPPIVPVAPSVPLEVREPEPAGSPGRSRSALPLVLGGGLLFALVAALVAVVIVVSRPNGAAFSARVGELLRKQNATSDDVAAIKQLYVSEKTKSPGAIWVRRAETDIRAALESRAEAWFGLRTRYGTDCYAYPADTPCSMASYFENAYDLLQEVDPSNKRFKARYFFLRAKRRSDVTIGEYDAALADLNEALRLEPNWALAINEIGNIYTKEKWPSRDLKRAERYYLMAVEADATFTWAYKNLANYYLYELKQRSKGRDYLMKARQLYPEYPKTIWEIGDTYYNDGDLLRAKEYYEEAKRYLLQRNETADAQRIDAAIAKCDEE